MIQRVTCAKKLEGEIEVPGDKSISHRAVILNSIASGSARIGNFAQSEDCLSTVNCLQKLGVPIEVCGDNNILVKGTQLTEAEDILDAGNSGTTMRLLTGLLSAQPFLSVISGDASLRSRPMSRIINPLRLMGAQIWGRDNDSKAPLVIKGGGLKGIEYDLPIASAQLKSALLIAGLYANGKTVVIERMASRDHTERMLKAMGASIETTGNEIRVSSSTLKALDVIVPGDISAAAFWLVAGTIHPAAKLMLKNVGINRTRNGILDVLQLMGAKFEIGNQNDIGGEFVADIVIETSSLRGVSIGGDIIPRLIDEIPLVALAGSVAEGETIVRDAQELRVKESDRIAMTVKELSKFGIVIEELPDGMIIRGGRKLHAAECDSHGDHRLAMMLAIAGLIAQGGTSIDNAEAADVSYSGFWQDLASVSCKENIVEH